MCGASFYADERVNLRTTCACTTSLSSRGGGVASGNDATVYTPPRDMSLLTGTKRIGELKLSASAVDQTGIGYRR